MIEQVESHVCVCNIYVYLHTLELLNLHTELWWHWIYWITGTEFMYNLWWTVYIYMYTIDCYMYTWYISQVVYKFSAILMENNICVKRGLLDCILCRVSCWESPKTVSLCDWGWGAFLRCIKITRILQDKNGAVWQKRITELNQLIRLEKTLALQKITVWERLDCISLRQGDALAWYFSMSGDFKENRLELSRWKI